MIHQQTAPEPEAILEEWLAETEQARARELLERLIGRHADPLIRRIVTFKLAPSSTGSGIQRADVEDVCATALCNLMGRLSRLKSSGESAAVRSFSGYAATIAFNACNEYFRARKPAWLILSMKLRYLATHSPQLAIWENGEGQEFCGFARTRGRQAVSDLSGLAEESRKLRQARDPRRLSLGELVEAILNAAGGPMVFEDLVDLAAEWSGVKETRLQSMDVNTDEGVHGWEQVPDARPPTDVALIDRYFMSRLWTEICELPLTHRKALLLNLNDSAGGDIQLFDFLGIATIEQIAKVLEIEPKQFAALWKELPWDDARIAQELGISRQDVANRRSAARKRLARRLKESASGN